MKKRVLAIMLVCFMLVSLLPMGALAEEIKPTCPGKGEDHYQSTCTNVFVKHEPGVCGGYAYDVYKCEVCGDHFADHFVKLDGACDMKVVKEADCENAGSMKCTICGKTEVIPAKGHTPGEREGDCETGYTTKCTVCDKVITKLPGEHVWGDRPSKIAKAPTKTEPGLAEYTCTLCGAVKEVIVYSHLCEENLVDVEGKEPTCTEDGYTAHQKCTFCGELFGKETLPATGHGEPKVQLGGETVTNRYGSYLTFTSPMTGIITITNSMNGELKLWVSTGVDSWGYDNWDQEAYAPIAAGETYELEATAGVKYRLYGGWSNQGDFGYSYEFTETIVEGDCTTEGTKTWICSVCDKEIVENLGVKHSDFVVLHEVEATCTTFGYKVVTCVDCGYYDVQQFPKLGHTTYEEALAKGDVYDWSATCESEYEVNWYCERCGEYLSKIVPPLDHNYKEFFIEKATCKNGSVYFTACADEFTTSTGWATEHVYVDVATGKPIYDGKELRMGYATATGADVGYWYATATVYLTSKDTITIDKVEYPVIWVDNTLGDHDHGSHPKTIAPTCTEDGLTIYWCVVCEADIVITAEQDPSLKATGHKPGEIVEYAPTCNTEGKREQKCLVCGEILFSEPIAIEDTTYVYQSYESAAEAHNLEGVEPEIYLPGICGERYQLDRYRCADCGQYMLVKNTSFEHHVMPEGLLSKEEALSNTTEVIVPEGELTYLRDNYYGKTYSLSSPNYTLSLESGADNEYYITIPFDGVLKLTSAGNGFSCGYDISGSNKTEYSLRVTAGQEVSLNIMCYYGAVEIVISLEADVPAPEYKGLDATCTDAGYTAQYYCERCGELQESKEIKALGHNFTKATCTELATCTVCGVTKGDYAHDWAAATCVTAKTCKLCGETIGEALGHNYVETDKLLPENRKETDEYTYVHYECDRCGDAEYINHYVAYCIHEISARPNRELSKEATCLADGKRVYTCTKCNIVMKEEPIARLHHTNKDGADLEICANDELTDRTCAGCKKPIAKVGHEIVDTYYDANCLTSAYIAHNCQKCAYYEITELNDEKGPHNWSDWAYVEDNGIIVGQARVCKICGEEQTESVTCIAYSAKIENALVPGAAITDGSTVKVTISITGSEDNVWGFKLDIPYTPNMTFVKAEFVTAKFTYAQVANDNGGYITVIANAAGEETLNSTEAVVELYFTVATADQFITEELAVDFTNIQTLDAAGKPVTALSAPASVNTIVLMDLDLDGDITLADALALYNLIEADGYNAAADLDKDKELTLNDFLALYDYLSGVKDYEDIVALQ